MCWVYAFLFFKASKRDIHDNTQTYITREHHVRFYANSRPSLQSHEFQVALLLEEGLGINSSSHMPLSTIEVDSAVTKTEISLAHAGI